MSPPQNRSDRSLRVVMSLEKERRKSDAEMVNALRVGEPWAARAIWDRHSGLVHGFLSRALDRSDGEIEDLTQEVFLRIFSRAKVIREPAALREFVFSVAIRVLKRQLRHRWVRRRVILSDSGNLPDVADEQRSDEAARHALRRCYRILDGLGVRERAAFTLRYVEGMTVDEVATAMEVSRSTAKRLVGRSSAAVAAQVGRDVDLSHFFFGDGGGDSDET